VNTERLEQIARYMKGHLSQVEAGFRRFYGIMAGDIGEGTIAYTVWRREVPDGGTIELGHSHVSGEGGEGDVRHSRQYLDTGRTTQVRSKYVYLLLVAGLLWSPLVSAAELPNIVIILTDDQGYADISFNPHHAKEVSTPHMDAMAKEGTWFSNAYISGNVCSPTRLGLMTGRYQQRNGVYTAGEGGTGIDPAISIFPAFLKPAGYVCGAFGKWHLGIRPEHNAVHRGFDYFYGFMGRGAHDYYKLEGEFFRNAEPLKDQGYLTQRLTDEAVGFIQREKAKPFFVYLAYNAVHSPQQAPKEDIERYKKAFPDLSEDRAILMAMLYHLDNGVGRVVQTLKQEGLWENTLMFFLTDNGGAPNMQADCAPLRGHKGQNYEGGIRTPWVVSWPAGFKGSRTIDTPVIGLDILPTVLDAAGLQAPSGPAFDGKSLLPLLTGRVQSLSRDLFWSEGGSSGHWAVRSADLWKLVATVDTKTQQQKLELFNLGKDSAEAKDLAAENPAKVQGLTALYDTWLDQMAEPMSGGGKRWAKMGQAPQQEQTDKEKKRQERKAARKKK